MLSELENKSQTGRKYLPNTHLMKDCYLKYAKYSLRSTIRKQQPEIKNGPKKICRWQLRPSQGIPHHTPSGKYE